MAVTSDYDHHPDEPNHFDAAKYYTGHFLPPVIGDPSVAGSYSVWGVSYLNYHWAEYFAAGKFMYLVSPLISNELTAARLFNVSLLFLLSAYFIYRSRRDKDAWIITAFLLITPQVWYVFSYVNNDGSALFVSMLAAYQIALPDSILNRFFNAARVREMISGGVIFGLLIGLILIGKTNYYAFLAFTAAWLLYRFPVIKFDGRMPAINVAALKKYAVIVVTALFVLTFRCSLDLYVNGETNFAGISYVNYFLGNFEDGKSRLMAYQDEMAAPPYKPSTIENDLAASDESVKLKAKGVSFSDILFKRKWLEVSFRSFAGTYGYVTIFAGGWYYRWMALLYAAFGLYVLVSVLRRRRAGSIILTAITASAVSLTVFISAYLSWTYAFQAQGRYLFPVIPMIAVFIYSFRDVINRSVLFAFTVCAFLLSVYSFAFVALPHINN
jgi:hypothetical protein